MQIFDKKEWSGAYRVLGHAGSSIVMEHGSNIFKHPLAKTRHLTPGQQTQVLNNDPTTGEHARNNTSEDMRNPTEMLISRCNC